ncbi:NAD-dependent succinate-semialdehyde dehydrogenase [Cryptosporangium aurantiacum]|uniref:Succinate-semialdehyde dehydrogenase / glutarate-semialdehyde dehydrogenase n=1 Tax=Cryptosporangium aurantiacum TaxID=134849 RepID=A0A1M7R4J8_9ACTN|nr:NAD-dependent succinate-semialdehyde dehydrogenase [Cryptosporangium aurantiacum]SHN39773.1 succinate-semialdehyde dehydrogenase / glutarate-semialdehyde dehydrogenase [Cryptosporangium aurantiacum]
MSELGSFIDGKWSRGGGGSIPVWNPATGTQLAELPLVAADDLEQALAAADAAFPSWRATSALRREEILRTAAGLVRERSESIAAAIARELGKPLREARVEVRTACEHIEWAAGEGRRAYGRVIPGREPGVHASTRIEPLGPIAAFAPWNAPLITPARKIAGALAAGCTVVLKPAEETPTAACELVRAFDEAGTPPGVLNVVFGEPADVGARLIGSPLTKGATFTGSTAVGKQLLAQAAPTVTVTTMELGGYAPVFVLPDADPEAVADTAVTAAMRNSGQVCTSPTRFYVHADLHDRFVARFAERADALRLGDPFDDATDMGPVATPRRLAAMAELTADARDHVVAGGYQEDRPGWFWRPTLLADLGDDARAATVEPFGPMALTTAYTDLDAALRSANRLGLGLAAYVWSSALTAIDHVTTGLEAGAIAVNSWQVSLAETPFGGVGESGVGYEGGTEGLRAFQRVKFVSLRSGS